MAKSISCCLGISALCAAILLVAIQPYKMDRLTHEVIEHEAFQGGMPHSQSRRSSQLAERTQHEPNLTKAAWTEQSPCIRQSNPAATKVDQLRVRQPLPKLEIPVRPKTAHRLTVKFHDDLRARAVDGSIALENGTSRVFSDSVCRELTRLGVRFEQLVRLPEETLLFLELRAAMFSGFEQPDLAGMLVVEAPEHLIDQLALSLFLADEVEWIDYMELNPSPPGCDGDIPPVTPQYAAQQGYRGSNPGLNMIAFSAMGFARGAGIRVADCEYGCNLSHEDLRDIIPEPNQTPAPGVYTNGWHEHGTAVFGELLGGDNAYGVTGLAPDIQGYIFPEWTVQGGSRRTTCIANAIAAMQPGDIVLLEMQTTLSGTSGYGPAELSLSVWTVVRNGVDGGIVVVGAAGNGNQNLDAPEFASYRNRGDSGAIIVGAGTASEAHSKLSFSTYGSRVNVQGWGQSVFSTGYGGFAMIGNDANQSYTSTFSGTSSASPFIAAACAALQSYSVADIGRRLTPQELRQVFLNTGWPQQGAGGNIGRFPNLIEAANYITTQWGPSLSLPVVLAVDMGTNVQGGLANVTQPDDSRLSVNAIVPDRNPIREADSLAVQFTVRIPVPNSSPSRWGIRLEGHADIDNIIQRLEVYDYVNDRYEEFDVRLSASSADRVSRIEIQRPIAAFIDPATNRIRARVTFSERPEVTATSWIVRMDQVVGFFQN